MKYLILWLPVAAIQLLVIVLSLIFWFIILIALCNVKKADFAFDVLDPIYEFLQNLLYKIHKL